MTTRASRYIVGIDLGTTHTVVAYADTTKARADAAPSIDIFEIDQLVAPGQVAPRRLLPSVRYQPAPGEIDPAETTLPWRDDDEDEPPSDARAPHVVGQLALDLGARVPGRLVSSAKSWLSHTAVDRTAPILPWGGPPEVQKVSPVEASASYLRHLRRAWDQRFPDQPLERQEVVLTVPASFDEGARALTLEAARSAGIPSVRLVEEPQAAFYHWLDRHREGLEQELGGVRLALVVDVGGGTTDLTLIKVELRESGPRVTRIAVGDHLMLGGDNMDLALARRAEERVSAGSQLGSARFSQLVQQSREAKELLLARDAPESARITVLGSGSKLIGGARSTEVTRDEVREIVLDGFFPKVEPGARPSKRRGGIVEFGLPYVADPAITRHLAAFLAQHDELSREALGDAAPPPGALAVPDAVLFNGGVFLGAALADRVVEVLGEWRGDRPDVLENDVPELAVARGAVAYGLARRGVGLKIGGGSPRNYFLLVDQEAGGPRSAVCVLPRGAEESEEIVLESRTFSLRLGRPVRFHLVSSSSEVRHVRPGDVIAIEGEGYRDLPPIAAVLEDASGAARDVPVRLITSLTEIGTLEMSLVEADTSAHRRWKLELVVRGGGGEDLPARPIRQLHARFAEATERVRLVYGKSASDVTHRDVKTLRNDLEKILGARDTWDTPLLRELFGALFSGAKRRRRSEDHERVWFNLVGYALRPGFGYPLDDWRVKQLVPLLEQGVQFVNEAQNWAEWWILWRRVAGGLDARTQERVLDEVEWYLEPQGRAPKKRPAGPKKLGYDDMVRLAGSLEHVSAERKAKVGGWLVSRLSGKEESSQTWWAVGRLGARVPFYGSAHNVVPRSIATSWLERCLAVDWKVVDQAAFAATLLARASGDRERDVAPELRDQVASRLERIAAPRSWVTMVREVTHLEAADERRIFGESLPPGLRLLD